MILLIAPVAQTFAQGKNSSGGGSGGGAVEQDQTRDQDRVRDPSTHEGDEPDQDRLRQQDQDRLKINQQYDDTATSTATSSSSLRLMIQQREREFEKEASTSDQKIRNMVQNENRVRVAVQALLLSKDFLGGIGPQVSEIARQISNSQASTTEAEINIERRSLLQRIFFGWDISNSSIIEREITQNQEKIARLKDLIGNASGISAEVRNMLEEQIQNMETEQERLRKLSEDEAKLWGIFSWRF